MINRREFLGSTSTPDPAVEQSPFGESNSPSGRLTTGAEVVSSIQVILEDIRREEMKSHPEVLAVTSVQGSNIIASGDTTTKRVVFEVGGKPVMVYRLLIYSSYTGNCAISFGPGLANLKDGIVIAASTIPLFLEIAVAELYLVSDGAHALPVNTPADSTNGGLDILGWTIPDYDRNRRL